jgi:hypothetical protein
MDHMSVCVSHLSVLGGLVPLEVLVCVELVLGRYTCGHNIHDDVLMEGSDVGGNDVNVRMVRCEVNDRMT